MFAPFIKKHLHRLGPTALQLTLAGFGLAPTAFAKITQNTIDPEASVTDHEHFGGALY